MALSLGLPVLFLNYFLIIPAALLVMMAPVSINGIGLREGAFAFFFGLFGVGRAEAVAFAWIAYGLLLIQGLLGGLVYAFRRQRAAARAAPGAAVAAPAAGASPLLPASGHPDRGAGAARGAVGTGPQRRCAHLPRG